MCGLAGLYRPQGRPVSQDEVVPMLETLRHRGPDDEGVWCSGPIGLVHTRLAILDLSALAAQPMRSRSGHLHLAYNGEIFNFPALRARLADEGVHPRSTGDTEILLSHLEVFGLDDTLRRIEGEFAFALWDDHSSTLTLARDRHGVKPIYYTTGSEHELRFGSELKALAGHLGAPDPIGLSAMLMGHSAVGGRTTLFRGVASVEPGHFVQFREGVRPRSTAYARLTDFLDQDLYAELDSLPLDRVVDRFDEAFQESIDLRLVSDAPLAVLVSGGVDSALVAAVAARGNPEVEFFHANVRSDSELAGAERIAGSLSRPLHVTDVDDSDFVEAIVDVTLANELPITYHLNSVPFYLVSKLAHDKGIKVLLTGEGSDEYFLGYHQYGLDKYLKPLDAAKGMARNAMHRAAPRGATLLWPKPGDTHSDFARQLAFRFEEEIASDDNLRAVRAASNGKVDEGRALSLGLAQGHLQSLLHRNDRLGMAWSMEARFPFLGHRVAQVALNLPMRYKLRPSRRMHDRRHPFITDKWIVRQLAARHAGAALASPEKRGFPVSIYKRIEVHPELLYDGFLADLYSLDRRAVDELVARGSAVWLTWLMLVETWARLFVHGEPPDDVRQWLREHTTVDLSS